MIWLGACAGLGLRNRTNGLRTIVFRGLNMADRRYGGAGRGLGLAVVSGMLLVPFEHPLAQVAGGLETLGVRTERWNIFPSLGVSSVYNDNVFAVPDDDPSLEDGVYFTLAPAVRFEANTQRHAFAITSGASIGRYLDQTDQNFNNYFVDMSGRWDVSRTFDVTGSFGFSRAQEDQTDPDRALTGELRRETTPINSFNAGLAAAKDWQRTFARASVGFARTTYQSLDATVFDEIAPGILVPTDETVNVDADRDRTRFPLNFRVGYDLDRDYSVFLNLGYTLVRFDEPEQILVQTGSFITDVDDGDDQDFETLSVRIGTGLDFDRVVSGDFAVGVERRFEDQEDADDDLSFSFDADLDWTLSPRTTLNLGGSQGFEPATGDDAGGSTLRTRLGLDLSYALTRQISLGGNVGYVRDDRTEGERQDDDITAGVDASYAVNRYASVSAGYQFRERTSTDADREFSSNIVSLTLTGRY